jgi:hypothetical protein
MYGHWTFENGCPVSLSRLSATRSRV